MNGYWHYVAISGLLGFTIALHPQWSLFVSIVACIALLRWFTLPKIPLTLCILSFIGPLLVNGFTPPSSVVFPSKQQHWSVTITQAPEVRSNYIRFEAVEENEQKWLVYSFHPSLSASLFKYGATCEFNGTPEKPEQARNPGSFDYRKYLHSKGIQGVVIINDGEVACDEESIFSNLFQLRYAMIDHINETYSKKTASWLNALVLGDDRFLLNKEVESFRRWNLSHLLAISGLHVGLFIAFLSFVGIRLGIMTKGQIKLFLMLFLPIYCVLAGGAPSVIRATLMAEAVILMTFLNQRWRITDVLSILVLFILWIEPSLLFQLGFQFSFIVTFSLLLSKPIFLQSKSFLYSILRVSLVSQLAILPIQLSAFYSYNPLSLFMNIIYIPLFSFLILPSCFVLVLLAFIPRVFSHWGDLVFQKGIRLIMDLLFFLDQMMYVELVTGELIFAVIVVYYILFIMMMRYWSKRDDVRTFLCAVLLVFVLLFDTFIPYLSPVGRVAMLDIGQGDTFVIEWPYREGVMIIDAAAAVKSNEDIYSKVIEPYLLSRGINQVDVLLLSHHDKDHMGSANQVVSRFRVSTVVTSPYYEVETPFENHITVRRGDIFNVKETSFHVLNPDQNMHNANDNSLVIRTHIGGRDWLFTGDISGDVEKELPDKKPVDVLKVSHHGSRFSTNAAFLRDISPEVAWVSVGQDNTHGHPSPEVLNRLKQQGIRVMRTDQYGAVYYEFSKGTGTFYSHEP